MKQYQITSFQNFNLDPVNARNFETFLIIKTITHRNVITTYRKTVNHWNSEVSSLFVYLPLIPHPQKMNG